MVLEKVSLKQSREHWLWITYGVERRVHVEPVDPAAKKFFLSMMCQPKPPLMSDYDRSITKSWEKKSNRRENQRVPQLGEQSKKMVPPLVVLSKEDEATAEFVKETNLTKA